MAARTYHTQADGTAVCPHRDLSVCPECATAHYFVEDPTERDELREMLAEIDADHCAICGRLVGDPDRRDCRCSSGPAGPRRLQAVR